MGMISLLILIKNSAALCKTWGKIPEPCIMVDGSVLVIVLLLIKSLLKVRALLTLLKKIHIKLSHAIRYILGQHGIRCGQFDRLAHKFRA